MGAWLEKVKDRLKRTLGAASRRRERRMEAARGQERGREVKEKERGGPQPSPGP